MKKIIYLLCFLCAAVASPSNAQISLVQFSTGYSAPVDIKNCGDDRLFIVEQRGTIQIADTAGIMYPQPFLDIQNIVRYVGGGDERGLLGLAFPADFLTSGYFYVDYVSKIDAHTHISRFHVDPATPDSADPASEEILLSIYQPYTNHKGGHVAFGPDGYLYIGMGDGGCAADPGNRAQNPDSLLGKILCIQVDPSVPGYTIPPTNPFAADTTLGRPEIWCLGMRNPWRFSFDRMTGEMLIGDVGQDLIEEVDFQPLTYNGVRNCGWHCFEGDQPFNIPTTGSCPPYISSVCQPYSVYIPPVHTYHHNPGGFCSITGGYRYRGAKFQELYAKYFYVDYCNPLFQYIVANDSGSFTNYSLQTFTGVTNVVTFGEDRAGELYCAANGTGKIYRFISADCTPVATINDGKDTINDCGTGQVSLHVPSGDGFVYLWTHSGDTVSTGVALTATLPGMYYLSVTNQACSNSDSVYVDLISPLNVTFAGLDTFYCNYNPSVNLLPNYLGGYFTGAGMIGATFHPSVAGPGFFTITYTYTDPTGCTYVHSQNVHVDACLNIPENEWTNTISVYPNPAKGDFIIHAYPVNNKNLKVEIMDITGQSVWNDDFILAPGDHSIPVHTSLASGVYTIRFTDEYSSSSLRLVIE